MIGPMEWTHNLRVDRIVRVHVANRITLLHMRLASDDRAQAQARYCLRQRATKQSPIILGNRDASGQSPKHTGGAANVQSLFQQRNICILCDMPATRPVFDLSSSCFGFDVSRLSSLYKSRVCNQKRYYIHRETRGTRARILQATVNQRCQRHISSSLAE